MNQPAKFRAKLLEVQKEQAELGDRLHLGDVSIGETAREKLPTIDDWIKAKNETFDTAFISVDFTQDDSHSRVVAIQAQKQLLSELAALLAASEE